MENSTVLPITVIIPCYRCTQTVRRAVDSVWQQTQRPAEVILVDDASGDRTLDVLNEIKNEYGEWIRVVELEENSGAASARNVGWSMALQPYIAFLDADDSWHPDKLKMQYEFMRDSPEVTLSGHQCVWSRAGENEPMISMKPKFSKISAKSLLFKNAFSTPTVMVKRDIPFRFQEGKRCAEDFLLWQQIAFAGLQVACIESPLAYVHKPLYGAGGLSAQLWKMEQGELSNFIFLYRAANMGLLLYVASISFSLIKFIKRLAITNLKRSAKIQTRKGEDS